MDRFTGLQEAANPRFDRERHPMKHNIQRLLIFAPALLVLLPTPTVAGDQCLLDHLFAIPKSLFSADQSECCPTQPASVCQMVRRAEGGKAGKSTSTRYCALYPYMNWGSYSSYYGVECPFMPVSIDGNFNDFSDDCNDTTVDKICFNVGIKLAKQTKKRGHRNKPGTKLMNKIKKDERDTPGKEPTNTPVKTKYVTKKPYFVTFKVPDGDNSGQLVYCRLWIIEGSQKKNLNPKPPVQRQLFAVGQEVEPFTPKPNEEIHEVTLKADDIVDDNVALIPYGNITFQVVTETTLR